MEIMEIRHLSLKVEGYKSSLSEIFLSNLNHFLCNLFVALLADRIANELAWHSGFIGFGLGGICAEIIPGFSTREYRTHATMMFIQSQDV